MRGQISDPRGWRSLDPDEDEDERRDDPLFPFTEVPTTPEGVVRFRQRVTELPRSAVQSLVVVLGIPGLEVAKAVDFGRDRPEMERRARLILSRFRPGTRFYSNVGWKTESPDFYEQPIRLTDPLSRYGWDAGLIAVNDAEVAMIWYFDPT
ncbi:hypothetical protein ACFWNR_32590 [Streptomyces virginiae]|uniref:hypothetical protein n=1 Tax=Streptomyces virginiae TaxID=1961 RepID=UPI00364DE0CC